MFVIWIMTIGLFLQMTGKILFTSGSANGVSVYLFFIIPSAVASVWLMCKRVEFFSREVRLFLLSAMLFMSICSISAAWGDGEYSILYLLKRSVIILFYLAGVICLVSISEARHIKTFLLMVCVVAAVGAAVSIYYQFLVLDKPFGWRAFRISEMGYGDWVGLGNPVIAGIYMSIFAMLSLALLGMENKAVRYIQLFTLAALLSYVFLTMSRTSWVGSFVAAMFLLCTIRNRMLIYVAIAITLVFAVICGLYFEEFTNEITHKQFSGRGDTWLWALENLGETIILGHGYGHIFWKESHYVHAHNFYLQVIYEQGLIGLTALLAMLFIVCRSYWLNRTDSLVTLASSLVVFLMVIMLSEIDHVITRPGVYWTIFWFPLAFTLGAANRVYLLEKTKSSYSS